MRAAAFVLAMAVAGAIAPAALAHGHRTEAEPAPAGLHMRQALAVSQAAIGRAVPDLGFVDSAGRPVALSEYRGKPLVVSLIYTGCTHVCPLITQRLRDAVGSTQRVMGANRFAVLTIGFDVRNDTPARMALYARSQGVDAPAWRLASGDEHAVAALAEALGFSFAPAGGGFEHVAQVSILDGQGRVYRQVYGDDFPPPAFVEPLKDLVYGRAAAFASLDGFLDRVRFLCTVYDPGEGRYRISYAILMTLVTGLVSLGATGFVITRAWIRTRRA